MATGPRSSPRLASWREPSITLRNYLEGFVTLSALVALNAADGPFFGQALDERGSARSLRSSGRRAVDADMPLSQPCQLWASLAGELWRR